MILDQLAINRGTDKSSRHHNYCRYYENHFAEIRHKDFLLIELGYGGYNYPDKGGESAKMWLDYHQFARIVSIDVHHKNAIQESAFFKFYQGSQDDEKFLKSVIEQEGKPLVIIDDASHICDLSLKTFQILFPELKSDGWYVIEDIEGSFWDTWSGGTKDFEDYKYPSPVNLGRKLINDVNAKFIPNYTKQYDISEIHFYQNIIFIRKK